MRTGVVLLGIGLGILWLTGVSAGAPSWMNWLDFGACVVALAVGLSGHPPLEAPFFLGFLLLVAWVVGLARHAPSYMVWWNFAFAIGFEITATVSARALAHWPGARVTRP
jgi:hypothetical protein